MSRSRSKARDRKVEPEPEETEPAELEIDWEDDSEAEFEFEIDGHDFDEGSSSIKDLMLQGSSAYEAGRYEDAVIAWQQVVEREPGKHPDIKAAIKDTIDRLKE